MKKNRVQETSVEVTVGFFMFMILLVLGIFTIVLSRENLFAKTYHVEIVFPSVMGLRDGDNVFVRGVDVGKIKALQIRADGVHVLANLEQPIVFYENYKVEILPSSVLGGRQMSMDAGTDAARPLPEGTVLKGQPPSDLIEEATKTISSIRKALDEGEILENLKSIMAQIKDVSSKLSAGEGTLGKLLMDEKVYNDLETITANLKEVSQNLADGKGTLGKLMSKDEKLYTDISEAADSIKNIAQTVEKGDGTLGKLIKDETLYNDVKLTLREARAAIEDIREATPVTTFTSIFFGAF